MYDAVDEKKRQRQIARARLSENIIKQADAIANHYCACNLLARKLKQAILLQVGPYGYHSPELQELIVILADQIKEQHEIDFGIELKWDGE